MRIVLEPFHTLIKERCGLLITGAREEILLQAVRARSAMLGVGPAAYYARLLASDHEFQELVNLLTINETYFFREPEQIRFVVERLAPRLLASRPAGEPVRILSAGCASGEEPYSLVMALLEKYGEAVSGTFCIEAVDIDSRVLAKAREGRYTEFSFRTIPPGLRERYFDRVPSGGVLKDAVRRHVRFDRVNLLSGVFSVTGQGFDVIFFRNVSIYFDTSTRRNIQRNLATALREDGTLFLGTSETLANDLGVLPLVEEDGLFYFLKPGHERSSLPVEAVPSPLPVPRPVPAPPLPRPVAAPASDPRGGQGPVPPGKPAVAPLVPVVSDVAAVRRLLEAGDHAAALVRLDAMLEGDPEDVAARVLKAYALLCLKNFPAAQAEALAVLDREAWSVDAFMLLGLAAKWGERGEEAIRWFKQAVYAHPGCWPAQYHLGELYRGGGNAEAAQRAARAVLQLLDDAPDGHGLRHLPLDLPVNEIRFLCRHQLDKQQDAGRGNAAVVSHGH